MIQLFKAIPLAWKLVGLLGLVIAFGGTYVKGRIDGNNAIYAEMEVVAARAQRTADIASTDVLIAQAIELGANQQRAKTYVAEIRSAPASPAGCDCGRTPRAIAATRGVRALVTGEPDAGPPPAGGLPAAGPGR